MKDRSNQIVHDGSATVKLQVMKGSIASIAIQVATKTSASDHRSGMGKLRRWKVGSRNRGYAKDQEAVIKTRLLAGQTLSPAVERAQAVTFREWADVPWA
jgi:hypothetical protein